MSTWTQYDRYNRNLFEEARDELDRRQDMIYNLILALKKHYPTLTEDEFAKVVIRETRLSRQEYEDVINDKRYY